MNGECSIHDRVKPISHINSIDIHPLPSIVKNLINERAEGLELGKGVFALYGDHIYHRKIVTLEKPIAEIKFTSGPKTPSSKLQSVVQIFYRQLKGVVNSDNENGESSRNFYERVKSVYSQKKGGGTTGDRFLADFLNDLKSRISISYDCSPSGEDINDTVEYIFQWCTEESKNLKSIYEYINENYPGLVEHPNKKDNIRIKPLVEGKINGMKKESLIKANEDRLDWLAEVSKTFSEWELESFGNENAVISFSGGKDSTVLSQILQGHDFKNVFVDTTIEFPETYDFIERLQEKGWNIDVVRAEQSWFNLCAKKGFPKYKNRWCCKTQKLNPFQKYLEENFDGEKVLVFSGERRWESLNRQSQPFKKQHKHIESQMTVHPMLDWLSMDIWMYTWKHDLPVNDLYNYFSRGGCWVCPFGLYTRQHILQYTHPRYFKTLMKVKSKYSS
ncbi:hypothetical protein AKJ43_03215 [candidate division MSBL1 archaeon SCGC-AAA261D19]|nr:hypothetical protein AKJ43_03215 [candidate division MSBL1 archaeon SCGC-AAA261D19]